MRKIKVSFVGISHLSLVYGFCSAAKGCQVTFFDYSVDEINKYKKGIFNVEEPNLLNIYKKFYNNIKFTNNISEINNTDIIFISKDIKTNLKGNSDLTDLRYLINLVTKHAKKNKILVLLSQVHPGFTRKYFSKHKRIYYQVETLIFGDAVNRALNQERIIIGCEDINKKIDKKYLKYLNLFRCKILKMKFETAELAKISINAFLASSITTANVLTEISNKIGANWNQIIDALRLDKRIGPFAYLNPGLGISGGNLERDLNTIIKYGSKFNTNVSYIKSLISDSNYRKNWIYRTLKKLKLINKNICILGLSYKENTNSIKNSPSIATLQKLKNKKFKIFDPIVKKVPLKNVIYCNTIKETILGTDVLIIATAWDLFKKDVTVKILNKHFYGKVIIDPFNVLNKNILNKKKFQIYSLK